MRLIYCYIEEYRNIVQQEFNLAMDYRCSYRGNRLLINRLELSPGEILLCDDFSPNVSLIVGKTGSGKTNLLQLIGMSPEERQKYNGDCKYFLLYEVDREENRYAIETNRILPKGVAKGIRIPSPAFIYFEYKNNEIRKARVKGKDEDVSTIIVNSFQRDALRDNYFNNVRYDSSYKNDILIPRYIQPYDKTNAAYACMYVRDYIDDLPEDNIKRDARFQIRAMNWFRKLPNRIDEELEKKEYWFYHDFINDDGINTVLDVPLYFDRNIKNTSRVSPKEKFIHDLLTDYALYLRKWAALISPITAHQIEVRRAMGIIIDNGIPDCHMLPDGRCDDLRKRIDWLCQYIDLHTDEMYGNRGLLWQIGTDIVDIADAFQALDDEYFSDGLFSCYIEDIDFNDKAFYNLFERMSGYRPDQLGAFKSELLPFSITNLSSGEYQYAKVLGTIFDFTSSKRVRSKDYEVPKNIILLLDEPETFMHPEMCRKFLWWAGSVIHESLGKGVNVQIIISTHSPFMLSDVLPSQITRIDYDDNGYCRVLDRIHQSYGGNIYAIMSDGFFLDYTIGELSRIHLTRIISMLNDIMDKDNPSQEDYARAAMLGEIVPYIGDDLIRESIDRMVNHILASDDSSDVQ